MEKPVLEVNESAKVAEVNKGIVEGSFASSFYTDGFTELKRIYDENRDNPSKIQMDSDAYINGISQDIPEKDREAIIRPFITMRDSYAKKAGVDFANTQLADADEVAAQNTFKAKALVEKSISDNDPEDVQAILSSDYFNKIDDDVAHGRLSPKQGLKLRETYASNLIANELGDILRDSSIGTKDKLKAINQFIDGKTGNDVIDTGISHLDRINIVNSVINNKEQVDAFEAKLEKKNLEAHEENWSEAYVAAANLVVDGNYDEATKARDMLLRTAKTPAQFEKANDLFASAERKSSPIAIKGIELGLMDGTLTSNQLNRYIKDLSVEDYIKYQKQLSQPLAINKARDRAQVALADARKAYGYSAFEQNHGYDAFVANLDAKLAGKIMDDNELQKAIKEAFDQTDSLYPRSKAGTLKAIDNFNTEHKLIFDDVNVEITANMREKVKKSGRTMTDISSIEKKQIINATELEYFHDWMIQNGKTQKEANKALNDYRKAKGEK